ncbi:amino acid adenylation domain-containing protein, partial [Undibacterium sp.]|uniref:non-ribosomal peptide synthetase n=1 Tax=Undibacterium sp. TaxID=1914977 RepID=UPI00374DFA58
MPHTWSTEDQSNTHNDAGKAGISPAIHPAIHPNILYGPQRPDLIHQEVLADLLEATVCRSPDAIALMSGGEQLSYRELDARASLAASHLIAAGVRPGHIIGLWLPRGMDLLVMQAGIAKTGAAWLPFDADTPVDRVAVCLEDAQAYGIVSCAVFAPSLAVLATRAWTAEVLAEPHEAAVNGTQTLHRRAEVLPSHPAYVIYTSGSTGKPKGIAITQGSICHFLRSENAVLGVRSTDRVYQGFSVAFDMSFEEIWISYLVGATLWIAPKEVAVDPDALPRALVEQQISVLHAVPTLLALFNQDVASLRIINLGGEMCPEALVARWARPGRQVFNTYGPTEATVSASLAELHANEPVTIGTPLPNYGLLVIDAAVENGLRLLPRGEIGELCITGPGIAAGYLGRPELTAEKFLANPWSTQQIDQRLYRTGDLARIDEDGQVLCLGRADDQVKIRGFRVELGEIEAVLAKQPGVGTVAVILRQEQGIDQLIAFIVPDSADGISTPALRAALAAALPPYMVPARYESLDEMPRLTSGKIDRKLLKEKVLAPSAGLAESDLPETPAEEVLFAALGKLFPGQAIRRDADFFADLGGHSLFAARLVSSLRTDARFAYFKISDIYQDRSIGRIAEVLMETQVLTADASAEWAPPSGLKRWVCGAAQAFAIPWLVAMRMVQWLAPFFAYHFFTGDPDDSIVRASLLSVGVFIVLTLVEFGIAIACKWLIVGRLKPGRYPLWGLTYFRWWFVDRLIEAAPTYMLSGSSLYAWWLRALGAKIGNDVIVGSMTLRAADLLTIGNGVSIGNACNFENARVERGELIIGRITLGNDAYVGSYSVLEGDVSIGDAGHLDGQSALSQGQSVPAGRMWRGSPARDVGAFDPASNPPRPAVSNLRYATE